MHDCTAVTNAEMWPLNGSLNDKQFPPLLRAKTDSPLLQTSKMLLQLPVGYHQDGGYDDQKMKKELFFHLSFGSFKML